jgi:hypothetical protein
MRENLKRAIFFFDSSSMKNTSFILLLKLWVKKEQNKPVGVVKGSVG